MTKIIFIGSLYPKERFKEIVKHSKKIVDNASNTFQWALIEGFTQQLPNINIISLPAIHTFPLYKKGYFKHSTFSHSKNLANDNCLGFSNIFLIKHFSKCWNLYLCLKKMLKKNDDAFIIIYSIHSPLLIAVEMLRKTYKKIKVCLIVPDLPEYMSESRNVIYLLLKKIDRRIILKSLKHIDCFVLLSPYMREKLPIVNKPWIQIEGIYNSNKSIENVPKEELKTILYTGNLGKRYGILDLLNVFSGIEDPNYRLWIRGNGKCLSEIKNRILKDRRIIYYEQMSRQNLIILQKKATLLINPVHSFETFTKYFFPSKTMEYLASGTPTLMCRLACLPKEYEPFIYFFDEESIEGMRNKIIKVCSKKPEELERFGKKASNFILKEKNAIVQTKKIIKMLNSL